MQKMRRFVEKFTEKSGTYTHPTEGVTEAVILGLASECRRDQTAPVSVPVLPGQDRGDQASHLDLRL